MNPSSGCGVHCPLVYLSTCPSDGSTPLGVVSTSVRSFSCMLSILVLRSIIGCYVLMSMV